MALTRYKARGIRGPGGREDRMEKRLQVHEAPGITVTFDPNTCAHGGTCRRGLPGVFDLGRRLFIKPEPANPDEA